ncbi:MAG: hypothetical protein LBG27_08245 [Spirochaetaceae bacterium]|jgi:hypothetical protein|nr:hypothetical protein [Spirochaetaceae bacterium]
MNRLGWQSSAGPAPGILVFYKEKHVITNLTNKSDPQAVERYPINLFVRVRAVRGY